MDVSTAQRFVGDRVCNKVLSMPEFLESKGVGIYLSMSAEIDTTPILRRLLSPGVVLLLSVNVVDMV